MRPPRPPLTERNLPSQKGKVFIVTGATSGVGYQLAKMLFLAGGKVYLAVRFESKAQEMIKKLTCLAIGSPSTETSAGQLEYLHLELGDLSTIKSSAEEFKQRESRLDVLWNNAGVSLPPLGSKSKQDHELQIATNCYGPYLFTQLLLPIFKATAANSTTPASVRIVWSSSIVVDTGAPQGGIVFEDLTSPPPDQTRNYTTSKTGNWFLASELACQVGGQGILSITQNPGNLKTNLLRHKSVLYRMAVSPLLYDAHMGAYTELWAGLAPEVTMEMNGGYAIPWGRTHPGLREDLLLALKTEEEGGTGQARKFADWCESKVAEFK